MISCAESLSLMYGSTSILPLISAEMLNMEDNHGHKVKTPWTGLLYFDYVDYLMTCEKIHIAFVANIVTRAVWKGIVNGMYYGNSLNTKSLSTVFRREPPYHSQRFERQAMGNQSP